MSDSTETRGVTGRQMCEVISRYLREVHGIEREPEAIWNMSPTGELYPVFALYDDAKAAGYGVSA